MYQIGEDEIEITFDDLQYQKVDAVDHSTYFECRGFDSEGNIYSGVIEYCCGEYGEITDIECIEDVVCKKMFELYKSEVAAGIYDPKNPHETLEQKQEKGFNLKRYGIDYEV